MAETTTPATVDVGNATNSTFKPTFEDQMIAYSAIYTMAIICVVWGSIRSLHSVRKLQKKKKLVETSILVADALKFPITASLVLFGLYIAFKGNFVNEAVNLARIHVLPKIPETYHQHFETAVSYLPKGGNEISSKFNIRQKISDFHPSLEYYVNQVPEVNKDNLVILLLWLITFEGVTCLATLFEPLFSYILKKLPIGNRWPRTNCSYYLVWKSSKKEIEEGEVENAKKDDVNKYLEIEYTDHWLFALIFTSVVGFSHLKRRHWITNNLIGMAFSIIGIESLHLASFKAGAILLCGLFFYDIFWVFGTDVMTTVAKSIDAPILLMFPQDLIAHGWLDAAKYGMLGLGDIVIPGIFLALLRRFDHHIIETKGSEKKNRYYFATTVIAYMLGLFLTIGVMHYFKAAQPALLYLVPACLIVPLLLALIRGEFSQLWNYSEEQLTERFVEKQKEQKQKEQAKKVKSGKKD